MRQFLLAGTAGLALLVGVSDRALADECDYAGGTLRDTYGENYESRALLEPGVTRDVRQLQMAAAILARYGHEGACDEVISALDDILESSKAEATGASWEERETERAKSAMPVTDVISRLRADELIGAEVRGVGNEDIGSIDDIVFSPEGGPAYVVVSDGGFLGIGEQQMAVPLTRLRVSNERDVYYIDMTAEQLESAPHFDRDRFDWVEDENWRKTNDAFYQG